MDFHPSSLQPTSQPVAQPDPPSPDDWPLSPYLLADASPSHDTRLEESLLQMTVQSPFAMEPLAGPYPERPGQPDCVYYLRTGSCGYGVNCRFNHPSFEIVQVATPARDKELPERHGQPECQYYLKTGTCKFGATCKYHHPQQKAGSISGQVQLNLLGLPLRLGEKDCAYYLRTGSCKFGVTCKFHHPQPAAYGTLVPLSSSPLYSTSTPGSPVPLPYQVGLPSWPIARTPYIHGSGMPGPSMYMPVFVSPQSNSVPGWHAYQGRGTQMPSPAGRQQALTRGFAYGTAEQQIDANAGGIPGSGGSLGGLTSPTMRSSVLQRDSVLPQRPEQPDCHHFIKTGDCKFGANCRFNHPKEKATASMRTDLNLIGLPTRPGQPLCTFYIKHGICKFGPTCKFDHPLGLPHNPSTSSLYEVPVVPHSSHFSPNANTFISADMSPESSKMEDLIPLMPDKPNSQSMSNGNSEQKVSVGALDDDRDSIAEGTSKV